MKTKLDTPLATFKNLHKSKSKALQKLGIATLADLLFYFPVRYDDFSTITKIANLVPDQKQTIRGQIKVIENSRTPRQKIMITEALVSDESGTIKVIWFNQPYLKNFLNAGTYVTLAGKIEYGYKGELQMVSPAYEKYKENSIHTGRIVPIYSETEGISSKWLRFFIYPLLKFADQIQDFLPHQIIQNQNLIDLSFAIKQIHFPKNRELLKKARQRLAFNELFLIQLDAQVKKISWQKNKSYSIKFDQKLIKKFVNLLPFKLTHSQKIAAWEILRDLEKERPMNRLLEGDVGSGKTVIAQMAALETAKYGLQTVFMAPTEILAKQHFKTFSKMLSNFKINIGLLTRTDSLYTNQKPKTKNQKLTTQRQVLLNLIKQGQIDIVIGTHALISARGKQEDIIFKNLALAIIDEQHRFGVEQRARLQKISTGKYTPHLLSMTATPIPRTLALSLYGDLDLSQITELPRGRKKIITKLVAPYNREKAYEFIRKKVAEGRQVFVICPRIESQNKKITKQQNNKSLLWADVKAVTEEHEKLSKKVFPRLKIGLLHGKLKKEEKEKIMSDFASQKIDILVSTSVVEVGIDIPNAAIMMIESAEKFGLAQLHQFRGRVGRSKHQSYCFLFTDSHAQKTHARLSAVVECNDGFKLAERDLALRGPGEIYGIRQSGIPDLRMASLTDHITLKKAQDEAQKLVRSDPELKMHPKLKKELLRFKKIVHFE